MTWMIIRLILSLAFVAAVLLFAARLAKKRGLGQGNGLIEVLARHRMGRSSTVNVIRIADLVLVVGATEEQVTLLAEVDADAIETALAQGRPPARLAVATAATGESSDAAPTSHAVAARIGSPALAGSVFDRNGWGQFLNGLRDRTVRRS